MRSAIVQLHSLRTPRKQRQVLRAAIRQLERAEIYLAAIAYMDLDEPAALRLLNQLRIEVEGLRLHLSEHRARIRD